MTERRFNALDGLYAMGAEPIAPSSATRAARGEEEVEKGLSPPSALTQVATPRPISKWSPISVLERAMVPGGSSSTEWADGTRGPKRLGRREGQVSITSPRLFRYRTSMGKPMPQVCIQLHGSMRRPSPSFKGGRPRSPLALSQNLWALCTF